MCCQEAAGVLWLRSLIHCSPEGDAVVGKGAAVAHTMEGVGNSSSWPGHAGLRDLPPVRREVGAHQGSGESQASSSPGCQGHFSLLVWFVVVFPVIKLSSCAVIRHIAACFWLVVSG